MKTTLLQPLCPRILTPRMLLGMLIAAAVTFPHHDVRADGAPDLGTASGFAVLAGSGITVAGGVNTTTINGDIGSYPTVSVTGLGSVVLNGVNQSANAGLMQMAQSDLASAFSAAAGRSPTMSYVGGFDLGGQTLTAGVYHDPTSFGLSGLLTLDAQGNPNAVFIIQAGTSLTTAAASSVQLINGAQASQVDWVVGSSATLGADSTLVGSVLAADDIAADAGATVQGQLLAESGPVTLNDNTIVLATSTVPEPQNLVGALALLLPVGAIGLLKAGKSRTRKGLAGRNG